MVTIHLGLVSLNPPGSESQWPHNDREDRPISDPDAVIDPRCEIDIEVSYPLRRPVVRRATTAASHGFTRQSFADAVKAIYAAIYDEEDRTVPPFPGHHGPEAEGCHGIWGHNLCDLLLTGAELDEDGIWRLDIDS